MLYLIVFHPILFNDNNCKIPSFSRYTGSDINLLQDPFCIFRRIIFTRDYACQFFMEKEIAAHERHSKKNLYYFALNVEVFMT